MAWVEPLAKPIIFHKWRLMGIASAFALWATADESLHPSYRASDHGSITVRPAVLNALVSRDATANSCAAAIAAM
jgi:hypothetical protein